MSLDMMLLIIMATSLYKGYHVEEQILHRPYCAVIEAVDHTKTRSDLPMHALVGVSRELQFQRSSL